MPIIVSGFFSLFSDRSQMAKSDLPRAINDCYMSISEYFLIIFVLFKVKDNVKKAEWTPLCVLI